MVNFDDIVEGKCYSYNQYGGVLKVLTKNDVSMTFVLNGHTFKTEIKRDDEKHEEFIDNLILVDCPFSLNQQSAGKKRKSRRSRKSRRKSRRRNKK